MERVFISWTIENWITVFLMVALGYLALALVGQFVLPNLPSRGSSSSVSFAQGE